MLEFYAGVIKSHLGARRHGSKGRDHHVYIEGNMKMTTMLHATAKTLDQKVYVKS